VTAPATGRPAVDADGWLRLHPLTPLLRGGRFGLLLVVVVGQQGLRAQEGLVGLAVLAVAVPLVAALSYVAWRAMRYRLTASELQVDSGVLTRRQRRVPLARLQSVDVVQPFLARLLGLAELRLEVAGGGSTEAPLQYLSEDDAQRLRLELLQAAAGRRDELRPEDAPDAPRQEAPEVLLVAVPAAPLVWSTLLGPPAWTVAVLLLVAPVVTAVDARALGVLAFSTFPLLLGVVTTSARRITTEYGFRLSESADGLRIRHGLFETRSATVPAGRIQVVRVREPLLWRPFGWVRVEVDVAGYAGGGDEQLSTSALLPVAPRDLALRLVSRVLGGPLPAPAAPVPDRAAWRAPLQRRRLRVGLDDRHLVCSSGVVTTTTDVVPLAKVQSLRWRQGPWQRRLRLASLHADTAGRRLPGAVAWHRDQAEARELLGVVSARARAARTAR
jgi:putative membrane protein